MAGEQPSTFGTQLRRHREAAGLSQEELAERANLTAGAIGALERGERRLPYPHTVQVLATALGLDEGRRAELIAAVPRRGPGGPPHGQTASTGPGTGVAARTSLTSFVGRRLSGVVASSVGFALSYPRPVRSFLRRAKKPVRRSPSYSRRQG